MNQTTRAMSRASGSKTFGVLGQPAPETMASSRSTSPPQNHATRPPILQSTLPPVSRLLYPIREPRGSISSDPTSFVAESDQARQYIRQLSIASSSSGSHDAASSDTSRAVPAAGSKDLSRSDARTPRTALLNDAPMRHSHSTESYQTPKEAEHAEPPSKRSKLDDGGWINEALTRGQLQRARLGLSDPQPFPLQTPPPEPRDSSPSLSASQQQQQQSTPLPKQRYSSSRFLSPSRPSASSPGTYSTTTSRRSSYAYLNTTPSPSPAPSPATGTSTSRRDEASPPDTSTVAFAFSDMELATREHSLSAGEGDLTATFEYIHNVPHVVLPWRMLPNATPSKLETLPRQLFMRIMMYCGYKDQIALKRCSYRLHCLIDLEAIPWQVKTETILYEERYNPKNFPRKEQKAPNTDAVSNDGEDMDMASEEGTSPSAKSASGKRSASKKASDGSKKTTTSRSNQSGSKAKANSDSYGKWGCYCCYKILPAYYFEGQLLEDKEGRTTKAHKAKSANPDESDKKVDMRVEYVQILGSVPGGELPEWLSTDINRKQPSSIEDYVRQRMEQGASKYDLRAYYKDINRERHLVAPLRGVNTIFTPSSIRYPDIDPLTLEYRHEKHSASAISSSEVDSQCRLPLYSLPASRASRGSTQSGSYAYELTIPHGSLRDQSADKLALSEASRVSNVCLPMEKNDDILSSLQDTQPQVGEVLSLRRVCIPCGTKFAVYRRDCNRKIISKTQEAWWVCDCLQVRLAGMSTGCATCGRKVIY